MTAVLAGLVMVVGLVGIVLPVLPGLVLVLGGVVLWAAFHPDHRAWVVAAVALLPFLVGTVTKYVVPGRRLKGAGVGSWTLATAVVLAVAAGFVIPLVGVPVGFVAGIFAVELVRCRQAGQAWRMTRAALVAVGLSMVVELAAAGAIITTWVGGLLLLGP